MAEQVYIGRHAEHGALFLTKHSWDCGWYWGFGYIGNRNLHTHFDSVFLKDAKTVKEALTSSPFNEGEWWVIRDLFVQAYALKDAAAVYRHGGHQTTSQGWTDVIRDKEMETRLNQDLEKVLDKVWNYMTLIEKSRRPE